MTTLIDIDVYEGPVNFFFPMSGKPIIKDGELLFDEEHSCHLRFVIEPAKSEDGNILFGEWVHWVVPHTLFGFSEKLSQENLIRHLRHNNLDALLDESKSSEFPDLVIFEINYIIPFSPPPVNVTLPVNCSPLFVEPTPSVYHWYIGFDFCSPSSLKTYLTRLICNWIALVGPGSN